MGNYGRALRFDDKPDYSYLRRLFRDLFFRQGYAADYRFDWTVLNYQARKQERSDKGKRERRKRKENRPRRAPTPDPNTQGLAKDFSGMKISNPARATNSPRGGQGQARGTGQPRGAENW